MTREVALHRVTISFVAYFQNHQSENESFRPEFEASNSVKNIVLPPAQLTKIDVIEILRILTSVESNTHYDGTGWWDYKNHLMILLKADGFELDLHSPGYLERFQ